MVDAVVRERAMLNAEHQTAVLDQPRRSEPIAAHRPTGDCGVVMARIDRIIALADAGLLYEGREACADLLFDHQPLLAARSDLLVRFTVALRRCRAEQLLRRFGMAVHGDAP